MNSLSALHCFIEDIFAWERNIFMFTPPNGMWVCAMDKYLQPGGKVIDQIYDGQRKNSRWDFVKFILSVYFQATSLCLRCAGGAGGE